LHAHVCVCHTRAHMLMACILIARGCSAGVSQSERNGEETYLSLGYGSTMAKLLNKAKLQPWRPIDKELTEALAKHAEAVGFVARGVAGKYQAQRQAQVAAYEHRVSVLRDLLAA
jgi:hypothetical protein